MKRVCLIPRVSGVGGMVSFRGRFVAGLKTYGVETTDDPMDGCIDSILVIGGTRDIYSLSQAKKRGVHIVQRLNGMNWLHRHLSTGLRHYLRSEYGNLILRLIRSRIAAHVIYQSEFARDWWERKYGPTPISHSVVYNAVDLRDFSPEVISQPVAYRMPDDRFRVLLVEGSLMGGYEMGLETAVALVVLLNNAHRQILGKPVELMVAGQVISDVKKNWTNRVGIPLVWAGLVPADLIPELDRSAHLLYSADINAACPNAVLEALACGTPVLAFNTGALPELVTDGSGKVVAYGSNPWKLEKPDLPALADGAVEILLNQTRFRTRARQRAETLFGLDRMVESYLTALYPI